jgi:dihydroorotase
MSNTRPLLINNGHLIDPAQGIDESGSLLIAGGKTVWVGTQGMTPPYSDYDILDAKQMVVCPGFIDLHCHLRQPGYEEKETIATGTRAAAKGGFTTVCCMPNTQPPLDNKEIIDYVKSVAAKEGVIRVLPIGCITKGRKGQEISNMKELAFAGVVAFSDDGDPVMNDTIMSTALENSRKLNMPVIDHCENKDLAAGGQINEGNISRKLNLKGIPAEAEESMVERDIALAKRTGGKLHIAHVSTSGSVEAIRQAKAEGTQVTAEVTPHHLTMTEETASGYNTNAKVNPPLRNKKDIAALIEGLKDGTIDAIATDHAPHTEAAKNYDFKEAAFGISGFETALGSLMSLVHNGQIPLNTLIAKLTGGPAKIIGDKYGKLGTLAAGNSADITVFDPDLSWVVDTDKFVSKGKNTPLAGATLKGKVIATFYQGKTIYQDDFVKIKESINL